MTLLAFLGFGFSDTIGLGSLVVAVVVALSGFVSLLYGARWKGAYEVASAQARELRAALVDERARGERQDETLKECRQSLQDALAREATAREQIAKLEALPNLQRILETIGEMSIKQDAAADVRVELAIKQIETYVAKHLDKHEQRAQERHDAQMEVMHSMVDKLNGGSS